MKQKKIFGALTFENFSNQPDTKLHTRKARRHQEGPMSPQKLMKHSYDYYIQIVENQT